MKKYLYLLTALIILTATSACYAADWQEVTTFTGASDQTTDYININSDEWRITWTYTPDNDYPEYAAFSIIVYPKGEDAMYTTMISKMGNTETNGTTYIHEGNKEYYLKIGAANLEDYNIKIEQQQAETSPTPTIPEYTTLALIGTLATASALTLMITKRTNKKA
jgi:hypothetical protein